MQESFIYEIYSCRPSLLTIVYVKMFADVILCIRIYKQYLNTYYVSWVN